MALNVETEINWQDYAAIIIRRRWFFLVPCVAVVAISMLVGLCLPKIYRAKATLLVQDPKIMNPLMQGIAVSSPVEMRMRLIQEELLGWTSVSRLVHELGLDRGATTPRALEGVVNVLRRSIHVSSHRGGLISLSYRHPDPAMAQRVLNTVTDIYVKRSVESQSAEAETAIRFIESEMVVYKQQLEDSERVLREFKELYAVEMPVAAQLNRQVISMEVRLAQLLVDNTEEHPTIVQLRRQIQELKQRRNEEIKRVVAMALTKTHNPDIYQDLIQAIERPSADHGTLKPAVKAGAEAYQAWVEWLDNPVQSKGVAAAAQALEVEAAPPAPQGVPEAAADGEASPDALADLGPMSITLSPRQEQEMVRLKRDYEIHRKTYQEMKQRLERAKITQRLGESDEGTKFKVIEPARLPLKPVSPNLWMIFSSSLAAGLLLGICAAFAAEYLDQSFQTAEDAQAALALPVIGSISTIVTAADLHARHERYKSWFSGRSQWERVKARLLRPIWLRVDHALLRWGL